MGGAGKTHTIQGDLARRQGGPLPSGPKLQTFRVTSMTSHLHIFIYGDSPFFLFKEVYFKRKFSITNVNRKPVSLATNRR